MVMDVMNFVRLNQMILNVETELLRKGSNVMTEIKTIMITVQTNVKIKLLYVMLLVQNQIHLTFCG